LHSDAAAPRRTCFPPWFSATPASVKDVLVVDDSKVMRDMVVACLRGLPEARFTQAASGLEAIERLSLGRFDLVVLDLNMPDISGIEVLEFVRAQDSLKTLPILVVTTRGDEASRAQALAAGATLFVTKPFTPEAIAQDAQRLLDGGA
jgi:two-component system, chemotaxis family, chemotaxis protein CheY